MSDNIWYILGGSISTVGASIGTWLMTRKKQDAEAAILKAKALDSIREFYEKLLKDNNDKLDHYIKLSEDNRKELHILRNLVDRMIQDSCLRKGCTLRMYYTEEMLKDLEKKTEIT